MYCKNCGHELENGATFCSNCGAKVDADIPNITQPTVSQTTNINEPKSKVAAALLAFFLGAFGVHNFYLGYTNKGVAQLLITILSLGMLSIVSGIWAFIEFILILTGSIKDPSGQPLKD